MIITVPTRSSAHVVSFERLTDATRSLFGGQFECEMTDGQTVWAFADEIEVSA